MRRYALRDDEWGRIKDFLLGREEHVGGTAADNRLFVDAVEEFRRAFERYNAYPSHSIGAISFETAFDSHTE
jgi:hypothetical protein